MECFHVSTGYLINASKLLDRLNNFVFYFYLAGRLLWFRHSIILERWNPLISELLPLISHYRLDNMYYYFKLSVSMNRTVLNKKVLIFFSFVHTVVWKLSSGFFKCGSQLLWSFTGINLFCSLISFLWHHRCIDPFTVVSIFNQTFSHLNAFLIA